MLTGDRRPAIIARCFRSFLENRDLEMDIRLKQGSAREVEVRVTRCGQLFTPIVDGLKLECLSCLTRTKTVLSRNANVLPLNFPKF